MVGIGDKVREFIRVLGVCLLVLSAPSYAIQVVTDGPNVGCEEIKLSKELRVYKDPTLFVGNLSLIYTDPTLGWEKLMEETPLLTRVGGMVHLMRLGQPREFKNFGAIAKLYELADARFRSKTSEHHPLIVPVRICAEGYSDSLGFVLKSDLDDAQKAFFEEGSMPPSAGNNPIPQLPNEMKITQKN